MFLKTSAMLKTSAKFVRILEQVKILNLLSNSHKRSPRFSTGYEGTENMFDFLNKVSSNWPLNTCAIQQIF